MNSLQSRIWVICVFLVGLRPAAVAQDPQYTSKAAASYQQLTRNGASILGMRRDSSHFVTCKGKQVNILADDVVVDTDKTCEDATNDPRCTLCVMRREDPDKLGLGHASAAQNDIQHKAQSNREVEPQATPGSPSEPSTPKKKNGKTKTSQTPPPSAKRDPVPPQ